MWIATRDEVRKFEAQTVQMREGMEEALEKFLPRQDQWERLMEEAGQAVFEELLPGKLTFVCGKGGNGGDGWVAARLAHEAGRDVYVYSVYAEKELDDLCGRMMSKAREAGVPCSFGQAPDHLMKADCVVDALLGIGAIRAPDGEVRIAIDTINQSGKPVVSIDVPSGVDCDTGKVLGNAVAATKTVVLGVAKPYLFQNEGMHLTGKWVVREIRLCTDETSAYLSLPQDLVPLLPHRDIDSHKGSSGRLLIVAGSRQYRGAAVFCALGAARVGAGLVTVASIPCVLDAVAAAVPEATLIELPESDGVISKGAVLPQENWKAAVFGPGLGKSDCLGRLWSSWTTIPAVLDGDALNFIAQGNQPPRSECVLTPHPGEFARLMETTTDEVQTERFRYASEARDKFGKTVLLKGPYSMAATPDRPLVVNSTGNPGMASAGMGDVLSGVIGGLIAQGCEHHDAACLGMHLHGLAADICAEEIGEIGYLARDVANALPHARAKLLSCADA